MPRQRSGSVQKSETLSQEKGYKQYYKEQREIKINQLRKQNKKINDQEINHQITKQWNDLNKKKTKKSQSQSLNKTRNQQPSPKKEHVSEKKQKKQQLQKKKKKKSSEQVFHEEDDEKISIQEQDQDQIEQEIEQENKQKTKKSKKNQQKKITTYFKNNKNQDIEAQQPISEEEIESVQKNYLKKKTQQQNKKKQPQMQSSEYYEEIEEEKFINVDERENYQKSKAKREQRPPREKSQNRINSTYIQFFKKTYAILEQRFSNRTSQELSKATALEWKRYKQIKKNKKYHDFQNKQEQIEGEKKIRQLDKRSPPSKEQKLKGRKGHIIFQGKYIQIPKRPLSSYMLFFEDIRQKIQAEDKEITNVEVGKRAGEIWRKIPETQKEKYRIQYEYNFQKYKIDIKDFEVEYGVSIKTIQQQQNAKKQKSQQTNKVIKESNDNNGVQKKNKTPKLQDIKIKQEVFTPKKENVFSVLDQPVDPSEIFGENILF